MSCCLKQIRIKNSIQPFIFWNVLSKQYLNKQLYFGRHGPTMQPMPALTLYAPTSASYYKCVLLYTTKWRVWIEKIIPLASYTGNVSDLRASHTFYVCLSCMLISGLFVLICFFAFTLLVLQCGIQRSLLGVFLYCTAFWDRDFSLNLVVTGCLELVSPLGASCLTSQHWDWILGIPYHIQFLHTTSGDPNLGPHT